MRAPSMVVLAVVVAVGACGRRSESDRRATREAEREASETTLTSAVIEAGVTSEAEIGVRAQRLEVRRKLQHALDRLDEKRKLAQKRGAAHLKAVDAERELLRRDLDALDSASDDEWASLEAKIDRDLREHGP